MAQSSTHNYDKFWIWCEQKHLKAQFEFGVIGVFYSTAERAGATVIVTLQVKLWKMINKNIFGEKTVYLFFLP